MIESVLEHLLGNHVQVVCGLIEDQEVRLGEHKLGKGNPALLAAREVPDVLEHVLPGKEEGGKKRPDLRVVHVGMLVRNFLKERVVVVQDVVLLVVVADVDVCAEADRTLVWLYLSHDHLEHRGLAGAVVSDDRYMLSPVDVIGDIPEEELIVKGLGEVPHLHHIPPGADAGAEGQVHVIPDLDGLFDALHLIQHLLAGLRPLDGLLPVELPKLCDDLLLVFDLRLVV